MKPTGIVRRMDELGRIVIPKEVRHVLNLAENSPLEIFIEGDKIVLQKYITDRHFQIEYRIEEDAERTLDNLVDDDDVYEELEKLLPPGAIIHSIFDTDRNKYIFEE